MLSSVEQAFVWRDEKRTRLKTPAWEVTLKLAPLALGWEIGQHLSRTRGWVGHDKTGHVKCIFY